MRKKKKEKLVQS